MVPRAQSLGAIARPRKEDLPETWPLGRVCTAEGCDFVLSRYNGSRRCTLHGGWRRRLREDAFTDDLIELMEVP